MPSGSILTSAFGLASGSIGAGILGLAGMSGTCGLLMAVIYVALISATTIFSMYLIAVASLRTGARTFEGISRALFPW